ncbi:T6SS effector phospholipase Tle3 domain-containing protein, partial [Xanthomonas oryzae]
MTECSYVVAQANALLLPNRMGERLVEVPADRPGIVIFIHGVNDPGGAYPTVEKGLCQGLNERLSRIDLRAGQYGVKYAEAKASKAKPGDRDYRTVAAVKYDPDTYLYQRSEDITSKLPTHSMFIPFYWGYRASNNEIAKDKRGNPTRLRSQYQDTAGNRLDANFAKAGGFFVNATSNLPDMYGKGFEKTLKTRGVQMVSPDFTYFGNAPPRRYFVLAAERLAMLVSEIRRLAPDDTITIMGHSQGTLITLLAQAMLAERSQRCLADPSQRCADCLILVDSPYSLLEPEGEE